MGFSVMLCGAEFWFLLNPGALIMLRYMYLHKRLFTCKLLDYMVDEMRVNDSINHLFNQSIKIKPNSINQ